jgi:hypothetical protein
MRKPELIGDLQRLMQGETATPLPVNKYLTKY